MEFRTRIMVESKGNKSLQPRVEISVTATSNEATSLRTRSNVRAQSPHLEAEDGAAEAGAGAGVAAECPAGGGGEAEDGLILREARAAPGRRGPAGRDGADEGRQQVHGAVGRRAHELPRQAPRQHVPRPERRRRRRCRHGPERQGVEQQREEEEEPPPPRRQRSRHHRQDAEANRPSWPRPPARRALALAAGSECARELCSLGLAGCAVCARVARGP